MGKKSKKTKQKSKSKSKTTEGDSTSTNSPRKKKSKYNVPKHSKHSIDAYKSDSKQLERNHLDELGLKIHSIEADGNCLFRAFSHQLCGDDKHHIFIRNLVCDHLLQHSDRFGPFLGRPIEEYIDILSSPHSWAGQLELQILTEIFRVNIRIYQNIVPNQLDIFQFPIQKDPPNTIYLSFHFTEHYNSVISCDSGPIIGSYYKALDRPHPIFEATIRSATLRKSKNLLPVHISPSSTSSPNPNPNISDAGSPTESTEISTLPKVNGICVDENGVPLSRAARRKRNKKKKRGGVQVSQKIPRKIQRTLETIVESDANISDLKTSVNL